jgi:hypothetical protein
MLEYTRRLTGYKQAQYSMLMQHVNKAISPKSTPLT